MLRTLLAPRLLVSHLLVLLVVAVCVTASIWQHQRLQEAREHNARLAERMAAEPLSADELDGLWSREPAPEELAFRRVRITGRFAATAEVVQRNQQEPVGQQGLHVLTPLRLDDERSLLVVRGWVPPELDEPPLERAPAPRNEVTVEGVLVPSTDQPTGLAAALTASDPPQGELDTVFHADAERLDGQMPGRLAPLVLRETTGSGDGELPVPPGEPRLDEGNHFSYMVQWASFALIALATYAAWLWRRLTGRGTRSAPQASEPAGTRGASR